METTGQKLFRSLLSGEGAKIMWKVFAVVCANTLTSNSRKTLLWKLMSPTVCENVGVAGRNARGIAEKRETKRAGSEMLVLVSGVI